ncbi:hypothetical protein [Lacimicrobium alkaliphilum]|nr:hypothetical protein [Lacimicrobium alkaliphilum]
MDGRYADVAGTHIVRQPDNHQTFSALSDFNPTDYQMTSALSE